MIRIACIVALVGFGVASAAETKKPASLPLPVALADMPADTRETLSKVLDKPTLSCLGPAEEFIARPDTYQWLLDHPDRTAAAWRKLGVDAIKIKPMKDGRFTWRDGSGSELVWQNVAEGPTGRIWYAEGKVKPALLLPTVPVKAVAVLNHADAPRAAGGATIKHQIEIYLHTDSKVAALATKMLGDRGPKMAEEGAEQLLMFFSGIARYAHQKPEKAKELLADEEPTVREK